MILYELRCVSGHCFEGWFASAGAFESDEASGRIICPTCGAVGAERLMGGQPLRLASRSAELGAAGSRPSRGQQTSLWAQVVDFIERSFEDVGGRFAGEARDIHRGIAVARNIRGTASDEEERQLKEEGIEFHRISLPRSRGSN